MRVMMTAAAKPRPCYCVVSRSDTTGARGQHEPTIARYCFPPHRSIGNICPKLLTGRPPAPCYPPSSPGVGGAERDIIIRNVLSKPSPNITAVRTLMCCRVFIIPLQTYSVRRNRRKLVTPSCVNLYVHIFIGYLLHLFRRK